MTQVKPILEMKNITKYFPGVIALDNVDFSLQKGEIHALMGENGAGKSTLIKILTGVYHRDGGDVFFEGQPLNLKGPHEAPLHGISTVYQEVNLIPGLTVAENIFLGRQPKNLLGISWNTLNEGARKALARLDVDIDVTKPLASYSIAIQQMTAIARALDIHARLLVLDEPTSSLDAKECNKLFQILERLKSEGLAILFITHFIDQVYAISDVITVLRNGKLVGKWPASELSKMELVAAMMGKEIEKIRKVEAEKKVQITTEKQEEKASSEGSAKTLRVHKLGKKGVLHPIDLELKQGEIVGLAVLLGSGRTEFAELLFALVRQDSGTLELNGENVQFLSPHDAISAGFGFCPEDRKVQGVIDGLTVEENIILALQSKRGIFKPISKKERQALANKYIKRLGVKTPSTQQIVRNLSGGNQQKVVVSRWLASDPTFLILDEPTRGIDVNAKVELQNIIFDLKHAGLSILFISSELSEVVQTSDRIAVLRDRKKIAELIESEKTEEKIMKLIAEGVEE